MNLPKDRVPKLASSFFNSSYSSHNYQDRTEQNRTDFFNLMASQKSWPNLIDNQDDLSRSNFPQLDTLLINLLNSSANFVDLYITVCF